MYLAANQCWKAIYIRPVAYYYLLVIFSLLIFNLSYGSRTSYRTKAAQLPLSCLVDLSRARGKEVLSMVLYRWSSCLGAASSTNEVWSGLFGVWPNLG
jgi:hypothetical protein